MKLVIFDMDQTLVEVIDIHDRATLRVFRGFFNIEARLTEIDYAGRSLNDSFRVLAARQGIPDDEVREKIPAMLEAYDRAFVAAMPADAARFILPGVTPLLDELTRRGHLLMLYTGDSPAVMRRVMETTGLGRYFRDRFCGTEVAARADMIGLALARAREVAGREFQDGDIAVIGDSVRDVAAGQQYGARVIAVATGKHTRAELEAAGADGVFDCLKDWRAVLRAIE
jgi:phosphoglycolate phosphatase